MGCDIHCYVEKRGEDFGIWEEVVGFDVGLSHRNYGTFTILAGVRNYGGFTPISLPKGLPLDVSPSVKKESDEMDLDGHSHSYLSVQEIERASSSYDLSSLNMWSVQLFEAPLRKLKDLCVTEQLDDVRIVFWFDN